MTAPVVITIAVQIDLDLGFQASDVTADDGCIGPRYGIVTENCRAALELVARTESVFHDPVYSSKAMAALIDHILQGQLRPDQSVVFVYTGGVPAIFAYAEDLLPE